MVLGFSVVLPAQYQQLTTDRHGTKVAFSSVLSLQGEQRNDQAKIFEVNAAGSLRTLRDEPQVVLTPGDRYPSNFPTLTKPEYSSDGTRLAFTGERWCIGGSGCVGVERVLGRVVWLDGSREAPTSGTARISANGRWAVYHNPTSLASPYRFYRVDFETGSTEFGRTGLSGTAGTGRRVVADDGTVLTTSGSRTLTIRKPGWPDVTTDLSFSAAAVTISNDARFAIAQTADEHPMLWLIDLLTLQNTPIVLASEGVTQPALSDDGMTLMFLSGANWAARNNTLAVQVWTMDMITGRLSQWTTDQAGIAEATISGDGTTVWGVTVDGRLFGVVGSSGELRTYLGPAPQLAPQEAAVWAPGSRYRLEGSGLSGAKVRWQGMEMSMIRAEGNSVEFIVPWAAALGPGKLEVEGADSPFQPYQLAGEMRSIAPLFIKTGEFIHGLRADGSPLTVGNPAVGGEVVTLLMAGLGAYDAQGRTLETVVVTADGPVTLEVTDSRVDPGTPGTYRLKVRIPQQIGRAAAGGCEGSWRGVPRGVRVDSGGGQLKQFPLRYTSSAMSGYISRRTLLQAGSGLAATSIAIAQPRVARLAGTHVRIALELVFLRQAAARRIDDAHRSCAVLRRARHRGARRNRLLLSRLSESAGRRVPLSVEARSSRQWRHGFRNRGAQRVCRSGCGGAQGVGSTRQGLDRGGGQARARP